MIKKLKKLFKYDKSRYENILDDPSSKLGNFLDTFILSLVLIFPLVLIFESIGSNAIAYEKQIFVFDFFISLVFALEYIYRLIRAKNWLKFIITPIRIIDLLSFLPFFLWLFTWGLFKILKVLRILRIFRLLKRIPLTSGFINSLKSYADEYLAVFTLYFVVLFICSFLVYFFEYPVPGSDFTSIPQALWWWIVTTATVWYWDIVPVTLYWKIIGSVLVFLWPLLWWLISAVTIMVFMETSKEHDKLRDESKRRKICSRCKTRNPKKANYCMKCWQKFLN